jgi:hypothetical protein
MSLDDIKDLAYGGTQMAEHPGGEERWWWDEGQMFLHPNERVVEYLGKLYVLSVREVGTMNAFPR